MHIQLTPLVLHFGIHVLDIGEVIPPPPPPEDHNTLDVKELAVVIYLFIVVFGHKGHMGAPGGRATQFLILTEGLPGVLTFPSCVASFHIYLAVWI